MSRYFARWPVTDTDRTRTELIDEAADELHAMVDGRGLILDGPVTWALEYLDDDDLTTQLVALAPVRHLDPGPMQDLTVERVHRTAPLTPDETFVAVTDLTARGYSIKETARLLGVSTGSVSHYRCRNAAPSAAALPAEVA